jgi:NAD(P) transhydrogenase subunit alpha
MVPDVAARLVKGGNEVTVQAGAGTSCWFDDDAYRAKGAQVAPDAAATFSAGELICKVQPPTLDEVALMPAGAALLSFLQPGSQLELVRRLAEAQITAFSLDLLPRISRAQAMDALSSQATVSGYRAALLAAQRLGRFFPMFMTAAGTVPPAKVLVMGAGVAGLQAIATARRLGAVVRAYDVRPAAAEEVRSLGATFVELPLEAEAGTGGYAKEQSDEFLARQREMIATEVAAADVVITTAAVPGRRAPVLVTNEMVAGMAPGAVIVDLAAETGGNVELSKPGEEVLHGGVLVIGARNMPSSMPVHASFLLARNMAEFVALVARDGVFSLDFSDEIISGTCVTHAGEVLHAPTRELVEGNPQ